MVSAGVVRRSSVCSEAKANLTAASSMGKPVHNVTRGSIGRNNHNLESSLSLNGRQDW